MGIIQKEKQYKIITDNIEIVKSYGITINGNYNAIVDTNKGIRSRGRSELLVINGNKVYLSKSKKGLCGNYDVPGGSWDKNETHNKSAIREAEEEARLKTKNVKYGSRYLTYYDEPHEWVQNNVPKEYQWRGYYTEVYVGEYAGKYNGKIDDKDKDDIIDTGKFYNIEDVFNELHPIHQKAITDYLSNYSNMPSVSEKDPFHETYYGKVFDIEESNRSAIAEYARSDIKSKYLEKGDTCYNLDKLNPNGENFLYIIGMSGAGKTTLGISLRKELNCSRIELDYACAYYLEKARDENRYESLKNKLSAECPNAVEFLDANIPGDDYQCRKSWKDTIDIAKDFMDWFESKYKGDGNLYIINGAQLPLIYSTEYFYNKPLIIKDINYIKTVARRVYREMDWDGSLIDKVISACGKLKTGLSKGYRDENKELKKYRNDLNKNAGVVESSNESVITEKYSYFDSGKFKKVPKNVKLYHGSRTQNLKEITPKNESISRIGKVSAVYASKDKRFAACYGTEWRDDVAKQGSWDNWNTVVMGISDKVNMDSPCSLYELENDGSFVEISTKEVVSTNTIKVIKEHKYSSYKDMLMQNGVKMISYDNYMSNINNPNPKFNYLNQESVIEATGSKSVKESFGIVSESKNREEYNSSHKRKSQNGNFKFFDIQGNKNEFEYYAKNDIGSKKNSKFIYDNYVGEILVDMDKEKFAGYVLVKKDGKDKGFIQPLWLFEGYRGYGFGTKLLKDAVNKYNAVGLTVDVDNKVAIEMYKKNGFVIVGYGNKKNNSDYCMKLKSKLSKGDKPFDESVLQETTGLTLYHGSTMLYDELKSTGIDLGNAIQKPGWSLFCWTKYEYAVGWAIFCVLKGIKKRYEDIDILCCGSSHIPYITKSSYEKLKLIIGNIPDEYKEYYVYTIKPDKLYEYGLGHSSNTPNCITIRNCSIKPDKVDKKYLSINDLEKYCKIVPDDYNPTKNDHGTDKRLLSFLMTSDYTRNFKNKRKLADDVNNGLLQVGDDMQEYMTRNGIELNKVSIMDRIGEDTSLQEAEKEEDFIHSSFVKESEWKSKYRSKFISVYKDAISKLKSFDKQMPNDNVLNYPDKDPEDWPSNIMIKYMDDFKGGPNDRQSGICTKGLTICELNEKSIPVFKRKTIRESLEKFLDSCIPSDLRKDNTKKMYFFIHGSGNKYTLIANSIIMNESASLQEFSRASIPESEFGIPGKRKFPLDTPERVKSAIRFFNYVEPEDEAELAKRIKEKAKKFGVAIRCGKKNRLSKYITKEYVNEFMAASAIGNDAYAVINGSIKQAAYQNGYKYIEDDEYPYTKKSKESRAIHKNTMMNNDFTNKE